MWITKILLVTFAIGIQAEISGLQNDLSRGYSYDRPQTVPAELAFYLNIPAGYDASKYIGKPKRFFNHQHHQHQQFNGEENHLEGHSHFHHQPSSQYIPPTPLPDLPFVQQNSGFRPINDPYNAQPDLPFIQENTGLNLINSHHQHHHHHHQEQNDGFHQQTFQPSTSQFDVEPRSQGHASHENRLNFHQPQFSSVPSQSLQPPSSLNTHSTSNDDDDDESGDDNRFMVSVSGSYNAPLPFPFGAVPIKFDPLPLKTHLRQEKLLPITSYEAKEFYKK